MRQVLCDIVQCLLGCVGFAHFLCPPQSAEGPWFSLNRHSHLRAKQRVRPFCLAIGRERDLPLLEDLLKATDGVLLYTQGFSHFGGETINLCAWAERHPVRAGLSRRDEPVRPYIPN